MLSLRPSGGSVTTLRLRCRMPRGNLSVGSVVIHSLKSGWGLPRPLSIVSRVLSQLMSRWVFCSSTQ